MASNSTKTAEHEHVEKLVVTKLRNSPIYAFLLSSVQITDASPGHFTARLPLSENHMNSAGSIHGATSAAITDWAGSMAISTVDLRDKNGVSVDIHVTYQSGAKLGDEIEIEGIAEKVGGSLGFTKVGIYKVDGDGKRGAIIATGTHTKYVKGTAPAPPTS